VTAWLADPRIAPPGGESFTEVSERVTAALGRVLDGRAGQRILCEIDWYADDPAVLRSYNDTAHLSQ
jgi:ribonuclease H / adenosylcobalamin/alpha-ribazole phosphatase